MYKIILCAFKNNKHNKVPILTNLLISSDDRVINIFNQIKKNNLILSLEITELFS